MILITSIANFKFGFSFKMFVFFLFCTYNLCYCYLFKMVKMISYCIYYCYSTMSLMADICMFMFLICYFIHSTLIILMLTSFCVFSCLFVDLAQQILIFTIHLFLYLHFNRFFIFLTSFCSPDYIDTLLVCKIMLTSPSFILMSGA